MHPTRLKFSLSTHKTCFMNVSSMHQAETKYAPIIQKLCSKHAPSKTESRMHQQHTPSMQNLCTNHILIFIKQAPSIYQACKKHLPSMILKMEETKYTVKNGNPKTYFSISLACYSMLTDQSGLGFVYYGNVFTAGLLSIYIRLN